MGCEGTAFGVVTAGGSTLAHLLPGKIDALLGSVSELERKLDVVVLHEAGAEPDSRHFAGGGARAAKCALFPLGRRGRAASQATEPNAAFLLNPVPLAVMRDLCYAGRVMPQKSTDFYPKLLSGLTLDNLDQCF